MPGQWPLSVFDHLKMKHDTIKDNLYQFKPVMHDVVHQFWWAGVMKVWKHDQEALKFSANYMRNKLFTRPVSLNTDLF